MATREERLRELLEEWWERRQRGAPVSVETLCATNPELIPDLRRCIALGQWLEEPAGEPTGPHAEKGEDELKVQPAGGDRVTPTVPPSTPVTHELSLPPQVGPYRIVGRLGEGGMGTVYQAIHTRLKRAVALKVVRARRPYDPQAIARFQQEMEAVGALDHPHIVRATDAGEEDGCHFLVMELVPGSDLGRLVRLHGPLSIPDACEIVRQAAVGLQAAHESGLVHRDIKPSNLMLTPQGQVKLLDLGLALLHGKRFDTEELTGADQVLGTVDYMAPEQAIDAHRVDTRADIYSLGCTLYKLLAGRAPFAGSGYDTTQEKIWAHARHPIPPLHSFRSSIPADLQNVIGRMLAKQPADRFASPAQVVEALTPYTAGADLPALSTAVQIPDGNAPTSALPGPLVEQLAELRLASGSRTAAGQRRLISLWAGTIVVLCLMAGALACVLLLLREPTPEQKQEPEPKQQPEPKPKPKPASQPKKPDPTWPADYPAVLRDRAWGHRLDLLRPTVYKDGPRDPARGSVSIDPPAGRPDLRYQPVWCRRLAGTGQYHSMPDSLMLSSSFPRPNLGCTLLALDDDRALRWFDFEAELRTIRGLVPAPQCGVFFGWRLADGDRVGAYFVCLDDRPGGKSPRGQVSVTHLLLRSGIPVAGGPSVSLDPLSGSAIGTAPLSKSREFYRLRVRAVSGQVSITVDGESPITFVPTFEPRGALGLWVQKGGASFGRAAVTALPGQASPP